MPTGSEYEVLNLGDSEPNQSEMSGTYRQNMEPERLLDTQAEMVKESIDEKREQEEIFGLRTPIATLGSHAVLRDGIASYGDREPEPDANVPFSGRR